MIWFWAAANTKTHTDVDIILRFSPPGGSSSTVTPSETTVAVTFHGPEAGLKAVRLACSKGLTLTVPTTSGTPEIDLSSRIAQLDSIRKTGVEITEIEPKTISLHVKTMVSVEAVVVPILNNVQISGDVTVDPATVTLLIPSSVRDTLPEAIEVTVTLSPNELSLLQHGVVHTKNTGVRLPSPLDLSDVTVEPKTVSISFKIQSNTAKTMVTQVNVLLAGRAEDFNNYSIELPRKIISNVTVEADAELIALIENGNATVFAIVRLASREFELGIKQKNVSTFLAIEEDGTGHEILATVEDQSLLSVELVIKPAPTPAAVTTE